MTYRLLLIAQRFMIEKGGDALRRPAVYKMDNGDYRIRVVVGIELRNNADGSATEVRRYDYFHVGADGEILSAPRGHAKDYRPGKIFVPDLDEAIRLGHVRGGS